MNPENSPPIGSEFIPAGSPPVKTLRRPVRKSKGKFDVFAFIAIGSLLLNLFFISNWALERFTVRNSQISAPPSQNVTKVTTDTVKDNLFNEVNPEAGFKMKVSYGQLGPKMIKSGVIDLAKFRSTYAQSSQPLTKEQEKILTEGSDEQIVINRDNSYFLLNFFWAVGLNNKSQVLEGGEMSLYGGQADLGNFASTGGWTLAKTEAMNYYSKGSLIPLTEKQSELVAKVAGGIYRPCCNNSTAFPDCNHGMALLGILELMAASGNSEDEMYQAAKYINAYWFPGNYYDLALYFKNNQGKNFAEIDPKILLSKQFSSASGWQAAKKWLTDKGLQQPPPKQSGGCGV